LLSSTQWLAKQNLYVERGSSPALCLGGIMKKIKLTPRLAAIAALVEKCDAVADIGTDHGFIPTYLVQQNVCKRAIASDINEGPLNSAIKTAQMYGVTDKLEFICAPGLEGVTPGSVDTVVIAGMGGETIVEILSVAEWVKEYKTQLILQPQSKFELFEDYLNKNGFAIDKAILIKDAGRLYIAFAVHYTGDIVERDITYFAQYLKTDPLFSEYATNLIKKLNLRKNGLESATNPNSDELNFINRTLDYLKNIVEEVENNGNS